MALKPYSKSRNTAFRVLVTLLYGVESGLPYLTFLSREERHVRIHIKSHFAAKAMNITIWRMKQHLEWLEQIGIISNIDVKPGNISLTVLLPEMPNE